MNEDKRVFIVSYEEGEYDSREEYVVKVYDSYKGAKAFVDRANAKIEKWRKICEKGINYSEHQKLLDELNQMFDDIKTTDVDGSFFIYKNGHVVHS